MTKNSVLRQFTRPCWGGWGNAVANDDLIYRLNDHNPKAARHHLATDLGCQDIACINLILRYTSPMKIISNSALRVFAADHPQAEVPLQGWRRVIEKNRFAHWAELRAAFNTVDRVGDLAVFDIGGNKYRLVAYIRFEKQIVYIKAVLTHRDYDKGDWKS
jgi:mRNA interferase HigB